MVMRAILPRSNPEPSSLTAQQANIPTITNPETAIYEQLP